MTSLSTLGRAIEWCNQNQGFALVVLTAVYVIATVSMVVVMMRSNHLARKHLDLAAELDRARSRPYVIFDIVIDNHLVEAVLKNTGQTAAHNVKVSLTPSIPSLAFEGKELGLLCNVVRFIAPGREFRDVISNSPTFLHKYDDAQFQGQINYDDGHGRSYTEALNIDLNFHRAIAHVERKDVGREIGKIGKLLEKHYRD